MLRRRNNPGGDAETALFYASNRKPPVVDGGLNPRIFGGGAKIGTNFAVDLSAAKKVGR